MKGPVGVIGLGLMGSALTERLLAAGFGVAVYNRTQAKAAVKSRRSSAGPSTHSRPAGSCSTASPGRRSTPGRAAAVPR
jgi:3-hydroxyisobutyrate dehydrogenase-like beta-hydroxyacid dehydrogenase